MFVRYRTEAFVLKKTDREEADRLFTVYTKDFGKLKILGRAIRKIKAKLRGNFQPFFLSEIEFIQGKTHKVLTDAILIDDFQRIRQNLKRLKIAYRITNLIDNLIKGQEPDENVWNLLKEVFSRLNSLEFSVDSLQLLYYYFLWNLLSILGYEPQLYSCSTCQKKLKPENLSFSPGAGGVICSDCSGDKKIKTTPINPATVKILRLILEKNYPVLRKLKMDKSNFKNIKKTSQTFLSFVIAQNR